MNRFTTLKNPFKETLNSKEELITDFTEYAQRKTELGQNALLVYYGFCHGEAISRFFGGFEGELMNSAGIPKTSIAYFQAGIRAWRNLANGATSLPETITGEHIPSSKSNCLQQIFYGAPGTGKSNTIKREVDDQQKMNFRVTFHPDSDYSTFVGCYKPTTVKTSTKSSQPILDYDSLVDAFKERLNASGANITKVCTLFGYEYHDSIVRIQEQGVKVIDLVNDAYKRNTTYDSVVRGGMACYEQNTHVDSGSKITYEFVPQAFTKAYTAAWNTTEEVYLIIEEINRGNCAQIFGDLFQLLDRKNGVSEYPIDADADLANYISKKLESSPRADFPEGVKEGKKLKLPSNLYIWATMNTSDQSLFPIDSAFKRRWDWKYIPIKEHPDKNYKIEIGEKTYDWWGFLERINKVIGETTSSEDKKLGYFFVKTETSKVSDEQFVGKVLFYLWNDVFKNYGFDHTIFSKGDKDKFVFSDFFNADGTPNRDNVQLFLKRIEDTIKIDRPLDITPKEETTTVGEEATVAEA